MKLIFRVITSSGETDRKVYTDPQHQHLMEPPPRKEGDGSRLNTVLAVARLLICPKGCGVFQRHNNLIQNSNKVPICVLFGESVILS